MKRFLSSLMAFMLLLSMMPAITLAASTVTVYLDPASGNDANSGLTEEAPVKTVAAAYAALQGADEGVVVFLSTLTLTEETTFPACDIPVTLTSKTGDEGITSEANAHIYFGGETTLKYLTMTSPSSATYISAEGHDLTIDEDVICPAEYFCLTGRYGEGSVDGLDMTVKSGTWRNILVGGYKSATTGNSTLTMTGGNVTNLLAPSYSGNITGNVTMYISGATTKAICAAPNETGIITGNVDITLGDGVSGKLRIKRLYKDATVNGTVTATIDGDCSDLTAIAHEGTGTGSIKETRLVLKSGVLNVTPCTFDHVSVEIPEGETLTLKDSTITANSVESAGTLVFSGAASLAAEAITGSLNCQISGDVQAGHTYLTAPAGSDVKFPESAGVTETDGVWQTEATFDETTFHGLVLRAATDVTVKLYTGYKDGSVVTPTYTVEGATQNSYYYTVTAGNYRCIASGTGYYKTTQNIYMSDEEVSALTEHDVTPDKRASTVSNNWEVTSVSKYTDELSTDATADDPSLWPDYADVFTTPWFTQEHGIHQQTTQVQMEAFIEELNDDDDNMYVFSIGKSAAYDHDIWAVFFTKTDLSAATTAEEAAALIGQDLPTILYRAQVHGNEPAAGEAALALLQRLDGSYGNALIEDINICILPRANPDGSQNYERTLDNGTDPNRDTLRVTSQEVAAYLALYQLLEPEIVIDGHEYSSYATSSSFWDGDMAIGAAFTPDSTEAFTALSKDLIAGVFGVLKENGLSYRYYNHTLNSDDSNISRAYTGQQGTMCFLLETRGIGIGSDSFARRVVTQVITAEYLLDYAAENADALQELVDAERQHIIDKGSKYTSDDIVILSTGTTEHEELTYSLKKYYQNGTVITNNSVPKIADSATRYRVAPTAYVIPAGASYTDQVLALMDKHGIAYQYIPAGATVALQQYTGTADEAGLTEEKSVTFGQGAYVFCLNQVRGITLSMLMEPDVTDLATYKGTLAQQGIITPVGGYFPIYRYCYDLNANGFINYTLSDVETAHITVYLDSNNGLDTNNGLTEEAAVKTMEQAYTTMSAALQAAGEGSTGTLVIIGLYELGNDAYDFPSVGFPVTITGKTAEDGISFTGGTGDAEVDRVINLHGDTTFRNVTLHVNNSYSYNYIFANGHKLVLDTGLNTTVNKENYYFTISGGSANYGDVVKSVDVTIRSGSWKMIYLGGRNGDVTGLAKLDISNASVFCSITASYRGNVGEVEMHISNTTVCETTDATHGIFAGTYTANSGYDCGKVQGDVTITLGENVTTNAVYASARSYGHIYGDITVIADGVNLSETPVKARYYDLSDSYTTGHALLQLNQDVAADVTMDPAVELDLNGHNITGDITVDGTLSVKDSQTDDYTVMDDYGCGAITGQITGVAAAADGYLMVADQGISFHKVDTGIESVVFRPCKAGIYYGGTFMGDEIVAENVESFGVALSITALPTADESGMASHCQYSAFTADDFVAGCKTEYTSTVLINILSSNYSALTNRRNGSTQIYGRSYIKFTDGAYLFSTGCSYSLQEVVEYTDAIWDSLDEKQQEAVLALYSSFPTVFNTWDIPNIKAA